MILIHMLVLLPQLHSGFNSPAFISFLLCFHTGAHVAFFRDKLGGFAVVGFQEVDGFLPFASQSSDWVIMFCSSRSSTKISELHQGA